jgi:uncharacterized membrane protein
MGPLWWIWMLIWVAALLFTVWLLVRAPSQPPAEDALAILRARFARGEINQTEYETARDALVRDAKELHR